MIITTDYLQDVEACNRAVLCLQDIGGDAFINRSFLEEWLSKNQGIKDPNDYFDSEGRCPWMTDGRYDLIVLIALLCGARATCEAPPPNSLLGKDLFAYLGVKWDSCDRLAVLFKALEEVAKDEDRLINAVLQTIAAKEK